MPSLARTKVFEQTVTDVAVLQSEVKNLSSKMDDLKFDLKEVHECLDKNMRETKDFLEKFQSKSESQHEELAEKVSNLEKIKWTLLGAAAVIGATGVEAIQLLLEHIRNII